KNRLLKELALTDSLTGLPNLRVIEAWAARQLSGGARPGFSFWVVLMDLDNFKSVNDCHGHDVGDAVPKKFAEILKTNTRSSNISGRIGGEEFLQVLTHADEKNVHTVADRIRTQFASEKFTWAGVPVRVTASFGIAGFSGKRAPEFAQLVSRADAALYRAKHLGRNRNRSAETFLTSPLPSWRRLSCQCSSAAPIRKTKALPTLNTLSVALRCCANIWHSGDAGRGSYAGSQEVRYWLGHHRRHLARVGLCGLHPEQDLLPHHFRASDAAILGAAPAHARFRQRPRRLNHACRRSPRL